MHNLFTAPVHLQSYKVYILKNVLKEQHRFSTYSINLQGIPIIGEHNLRAFLNTICTFNIMYFLPAQYEEIEDEGHN